jgi:hypothetical protein
MTAPMIAAALVWLAVALWPTRAERAAWRRRRAQTTIERAPEQLVPLSAPVIPCPACGVIPPDDYCADCDIIVAHDVDQCPECPKRGKR